MADEKWASYWAYNRFPWRCKLYPDRDCPNCRAVCDRMQRPIRNNDITCFGDFCILDEDCPWFSFCTIAVAAMDEDDDNKD